MSDTSLETLARAAGISVQWTDAFSKPHTLTDPSLHSLLEALRLPSHDAASRQASLRSIEEREHAPPPLLTVDAAAPFELPASLRGLVRVEAYDEEGQAMPLLRLDEGVYQAPSRLGYYQLDVGRHAMMLAVAPPRCFGVGDAVGPNRQRAWGLSAQVYSLPHPGDGGVGDSRAVAELAQAIGQGGGDALALSPLHAASPITQHYSPYSPSHRGFLNWLHADAAQVLGAPALEAAIAQSGVGGAWQRAQENRLVDWPTVYALRRKVFRVLHEQFGNAQPVLRNDFDRFVAQGGDALQRHARVAARQAQAAERGESTAWQTWPEDWRQERAAQQFAERHASEVDFEVFLQWLAARSWDLTCRLTRDAGQRIGLMWDLAVGFEAGGGEAWAWRDHVLQGLELGAPPDAFNPHGQSWGITSYTPARMKADGFRPFIELLRANMARGGGIRIDHIIGFQHIWVSPAGGPSSQGGYLRQPLQDLLRITALESWRHRCVVIGEDLGTVPEGLRDVLAARGVLGMDVLLFTRDTHGAFLAPERWRSNAVAMTTTHDLPPLAAWREGQDVYDLAQAQHWQEGELQRNLQARKEDVARLDEALSASGSTPEQNGSPSHSVGHKEIVYLAQTPSPLVIIPLEDALGRKEQPNLPGTIDEHPNWQHRLPDNFVEALQPALLALGTAMKEAAPA